MNIAQQTLWPTDPNILLRVAFLHVGQGASALVFAADGQSYKTMLVDINLDEKAGGIAVPQLVADLVGCQGLDYFVNTHPHNDHLWGVEALSDLVAIRSVWHSGHNPGQEHCARYEDLQKVIKKVKASGGTEVEMCGSRTPTTIGQVQCYILSPAQYVKDEIADEPPEVRYNRIHEHCAVLKFGFGATWVMVAGDADRDAWELHITDYHRERLSAAVFAAPHHGSRTFFRYEEEDEPYMDALKGVNPKCVVISAPKHSESQFDHPHNDAVALYAGYVGQNNVLHTGARRETFMCTVYRNGQWSMTSDNGVLAKTYPYSSKTSENVVQQTTMQLGRTSHVQTPPWQIQLNYSVSIRAYKYHLKHNKKLGDDYKPGKQLFSNNLRLKFVAKTNAPAGHIIYWQVVNTGAHAESANNLRGTIFQGTTEQWESTLYTGRHWIECFVVRNGICVARSGPFYVDIHNRSILR